MSTLTEKLQFILTADASSAIKGFKSVEVSADKALAKTETGASKGMAAFQKYGAVAGGAGLVIGAAALKAAGAFEHLAIAAGKFADSTGLSTEAASRWIEVAGDMGIELGTIETAVSKMDKVLATTPAKFTELGVAIGHAADGSVDVNATFLNAIDVINGIEDPFKRAEAAAALFGRGWTSMSELIATGSDGLKASLDAVDASKVITDGELDKAKDYREAMDNLKDKFEELALKVGEDLVPVLADVANLLGAIGTVAGPVIGETVKSLNALTGKSTDNWHRAGAALLTLGGSEVTRGLRTLASSLQDVKWAIDPNIKAYDDLSRATDEEKAAAERVAIVARAQGAAMVQAAQDADTLGVALYGVSDAADDTESALGGADKALQGLIDTATQTIFGDAAQQFIDAAARFKDPTGFYKPEALEFLIKPKVDMKAYAEAAALLDALAAYRAAPFEAVVVGGGRGPKLVDGEKLDPKAVAEAVKKASRNGLLPPGVAG